MQVLLVGDDCGQQVRLTAALLARGFGVICVESAAAVSSYLAGVVIDLLILAETRSGRIGPSCACITHSRNPGISVIVITDRTGAAADDLFAEVPQLYGVLGHGLTPATVAAFAFAAILPLPGSPGRDLADLSLPLRPDNVSAPVARDPVPQPVPRPVPQPVAQRTHLPQVTRTLIEPVQRIRVAAPGGDPSPVPSGFAPLPRVAGPFPAGPPAAARVTPQPVLRPHPVPGAHPGPCAAIRMHGDPELAALESELELVNRDRPSVLAASIADELPKWSQNAPKLARLTDGAPPRAAPDSPAAAALRRLTLGLDKPLGVTLQ